MAFEFRSETFRAELSAPTPLENVLRQRFPEASWSAIRRLIGTGKVRVASVAASEPRRLVPPGADVQIQMTAPRTKPGFTAAAEYVMFCDRDVVVVRKPVGISSVEHEDEPTCLATELRDWLSRHEKRSCPPLKTVHRLDKVTSGVMVFARTQAAQLALKEQFRAHTTGRHYVAVAHGRVHDATLSYRLVRNRGDGLRGVTNDPNLGRHSVTHVAVREVLPRCTLVQCRLETGRTHQIRIHLAHTGHPVVGDTLYGRDHEGPAIESPRTLLHAASLSFTHPHDRRRLEFEDPVPEDFEAVVRRERALGSARAVPASTQARPDRAPKPRRR
ncbi:MAG TPA: RluA family pseudouridine synthase [Polyangiaceae bacterium]|nr:RluA family pseudouridine synthase [Polyangiaceae bacterium]